MQISKTYAINKSNERLMVRGTGWTHFSSEKHVFLLIYARPGDYHELLSRFSTWLILLNVNFTLGETIFLLCNLYQGCSGQSKSNDRLYSFSLSLSLLFLFFPFLSFSLVSPRFLPASELRTAANSATSSFVYVHGKWEWDLDNFFLFNSSNSQVLLFIRPSPTHSYSFFYPCTLSLSFAKSLCLFFELFVFLFSFD